MGMSPSRTLTNGDLEELQGDIRAGLANYWLFPSEDGIDGFPGRGPLMFLGDQPSTSDWDKSDRGRRLFYGKLQKYGLGSSHLTDLYKARGKSSGLRKWRRTGMPADWVTVHKPILETEIKIVKPTRIICVGGLAFDLFTGLMPGLMAIAHRMMHFAEGIKPGRLLDYEQSFVTACGLDCVKCQDRRQGLCGTFLLRKYYRVGGRAPIQTGGQQQAIYLTMRDACGSARTWLTEDDVHAAVKSSKYLVTGQDPWRIWTYYRRDLVNCGSILEHAIAEL